jgi:alkylation response protein AidB-like acyl-CoA dehydrogenase
VWVATWHQNAQIADLMIDTVTTCFRILGADGIWDGHPLQRRLRDAFTLAQHASTNDQAITRGGAHFLGQPAGFGFTT